MDPIILANANFALGYCINAADNNAKDSEIAGSFKKNRYRIEDFIAENAGRMACDAVKNGGILIAHALKNLPVGESFGIFKQAREAYHAVMDRMPLGDRIPLQVRLGQNRPIVAEVFPNGVARQNVKVYATFSAHYPPTDAFEINIGDTFEDVCRTIAEFLHLKGQNVPQSTAIYIMFKETTSGHDFSKLSGNDAYVGMFSIPFDWKP